jgi:hypothetical protein
MVKKKVEAQLLAPQRIQSNLCAFKSDAGTAVRRRSVKRTVPNASSSISFPASNPQKYFRKFSARASK